MKMLKMQLPDYRWLITGQVKNLVYGYSTLKETSNPEYTDAYLPNPLMHLLYEKPQKLTDEEVKKMDDYLNQRLTTVSYFDVDDNIHRKIVTCYEVYLINDIGKTIERIN